MTMESCFTSDTVEVQSAAARGALTLLSVPAGRYVLTIAITSAVSGRTDMLLIANGQTIAVGSDVGGLLGSDLRVFRRRCWVIRDAG